MSLRHGVCALAIAWLLAACASDPPRAASTYTEKKGDTLYSIAWRNGVDYRELAKWNEIGRDYAIKPGQVLRLSAPSSRAAPPRQASKPVQAAKASGAIAWVWPTLQRTAQLTERPNGGQGFTIAGNLGQEVRAAADGKVVYTGSGLLGYGQLVIVQHNETYLSAYGHTQSVRVKEQENVRAGQPIATMGSGPNGKPQLYFEIRVNGRPVNPQTLLPR